MPEYGSPVEGQRGGPSITTIIVLALVALAIIVGGAVACTALAEPGPAPVIQQDDDEDRFEQGDDD